MKVFLVFIGLMIINITFISYQGDLSRYLQLQNLLKAAAEECAAGAALYYDEEAYSQGLMIIKQEEAEKYVVSQVRQVESVIELEGGGGLTYELSIFDDSSPDHADPGVPPSVVVSLRLTTTDLFHLPFLEVKQVVRSAKYELADY